MREIAIKVEDLWKQYAIGSRNSSNFRESLSNFFRREEKNSFWALQGINFELKKGEAIGIIGKNGAGKSTLLKILSKITYPTRGRIEIDGRVSSLLEVGTGFHPELTGRQNIFLNGTILGMTRREIQSKFDEIVDFSGVEKFIDTAVKHYSSGMKVRLAFSVAAHLEPEILIIDEVLAVGDAEFQQKCLGKMEDVRGQGRTILFVSHNLTAVKNLCKSALVLSKGELVFTGTSGASINFYQSESENVQDQYRNLEKITERKGVGGAQFKHVRLSKPILKVKETLTFEVLIEAKKEFSNNSLDFAFAIRDSLNVTMVHGSNRFIGERLEMDEKQLKLKVSIQNCIRPGKYKITLFLRINGVIEDRIENAIIFEIEEGNPYGFSNSLEIKGLTMPEFRIESIK